MISQPDLKFYKALAKTAMADYDHDAAVAYRASDEHTDDPGHTDLGFILASVCEQFQRPLTVLDLGCGCGRYFRFLRGAEHIVGVDVSSPMLEQARHPAGGPIEATVDLIHENLLTVDFQPEVFDVVYCIGVLGLFVPLDTYLLTKIRNWLKPDGKVVLIVSDARSPRGPTTWKHTLAHAARPFMPRAIQRVIDARPGAAPGLWLTEEQLRGLLDAVEFRYRISNRGDPKRRLDLVCVAARDGLDHRAGHFRPLRIIA
jgi:SAM-dependent methyltransferase